MFPVTRYCSLITPPFLLDGLQRFRKTADDVVQRGYALGYGLSGK
jgi:hypothetical protein